MAPSLTRDEHFDDYRINQSTHHGDDDYDDSRKGYLKIDKQDATQIVTTLGHEMRGITSIRMTT